MKTLSANAIPTEILVAEPGIEGLFTRNQAEGAIPNGSRVVKVVDERGDAHPKGSKATVLGSWKRPDSFGQPLVGYFVIWDAHPNTAIFVAGYKIQMIEGSKS